MGRSYFFARCPKFFMRSGVHDTANLGVTTGVMRGFCKRENISEKTFNTNYKLR